MRIINSIHERNYKNSNYNEKYMQNIQREVSFTSIFIDKNHSDIIKRLRNTLKRFKVNFTKHINNVNSDFN